MVKKQTGVTCVEWNFSLILGSVLSGHVTRDRISRATTYSQVTELVLMDDLRGWEQAR